MKKLKKHQFFIVAAIAFVLIGILIYAAVRIYNYYFGMRLMNTGDLAPVTEAGEYNIVYNGVFNQKAIMVSDVLYLDMEVINGEWADGMLFYAEDVQKVLYTTPTQMSESDINRDDFKEYNDRVYIRAELASEMFGTQYRVNEEERLVAVLSPNNQLAEVLESGTYLLATPNEGERGYSAELRRGSTIALIEGDWADNGYCLAMDENGHTGYIAPDQFEISSTQISRKVPQALEMDEDKLIDGTISLAWQQIYSSEFTDAVYNEIASAGYYINVVSPTWFKLNESGGIDSLANENYVEWCHNQGLQVWALFDNNFDDEWTYQALSSTATRQELARQLLEYCETYQLDGINMDFEQMTAETDRYYAQFLRELSIVLRSNGYLLTVDCAVPSEWTDYYQRDVMNAVCDYVIVMAYDEHYAGDTVAGSTSSQRFTAEAIYNMLGEGVSADKLVLGVPFYTRVWMGVDNLRSEAVGMDAAQTCIEENQLTVTYDTETGQNYAEGMVDETLYRIWLEDTTSMSWRLKLMQDNELAGVAAWSLGFENSEIWSVYEEAFYS